MFVQVYHTNHNTTDTAYSGPPSKGARKPTAPGFRVASTPHRKNRFTSCKKGPRRDSQPGRGGFYPVMCTPTGAPSRRVFSIHCGAVPCDGSAKHPATVPGRWWLVGVHSATAPRFPGTVKKHGYTPTHCSCTGVPVPRGFRFRVVATQQTNRGCVLRWVLSGCGSRFPGFHSVPRGRQCYTVSTVSRWLVGGVSYSHDARRGFPVGVNRSRFRFGSGAVGSVASGSRFPVPLCGVLMVCFCTGAGRLVSTFLQWTKTTNTLKYTTVQVAFSVGRCDSGNHGNPRRVVISARVFLYGFVPAVCCLASDTQRGKKASFVYTFYCVPVDGCHSRLKVFPGFCVGVSCAVSQA